MKRFLLSLTTLVLLGISNVSAQQDAYLNPKLSPEERAKDLCSRLTLQEKKKLMMNGSPEIHRADVHIPQFDWWSEALHGVGRNGYSTTFPSCIGVASAFNPELVEQIYTAVSDEARAKNTALRRKGSVGKYQCLSFWTPNINIFRDPRWGRGQETYGEDVYLNSVMGQAVVRGLQGPADAKYAKLLACAKHFAVHSGPEKTRHTLDINDLSARDLYETYLPAFQDLVQKAGVAEVMCAYQRFEGKPCCGSNKLLQQILRDDWGFKGLVVSDCGAISDFWRKGHHEVVSNSTESSAKGVIAGTDVECGSDYKNLDQAVAKGFITEAQIDKSVLRLLEMRFRLGEFDDDELVEWTNIPLSVVNCKKHRDLAREAARQQTVLLQNKNNILPLKKSNKGIMLMGPNAADSVMLWGIYYGQTPHSVTIQEGIENAVGKIPYYKGTELTEMTLDRSCFSAFTTTDGRKGLEAKYWNNEQMEGEPVLTTVYTNPLSFDGGGDTAFEGGVNLFNFSASYKGKFTADKDAEILLDYKYTNSLRLIVNGDTLMNRWKEDRYSYGSKAIKVQKGKVYDVQIDYKNAHQVASLSFNPKEKYNVSIEDAVKAAKDVETVIFVGGISPLYEREETSVTTVGFDKGDRTSIELPQVQRDILKALHKAGKKIVFINCSGSAVALTPETESCDAIVQAWYPGEEGGNAIADVIFGDYNPSGKLPVTFYKDDSQLPAGFDGFENYSMKNRTYRYFTGKPLYAFGHGLSYTTFALSNMKYNKRGEGVQLNVKNTGKREGTEIVQVYVKNPKDKEGPLKTLRAFQRVSLNAGETKAVTIPLSREDFALWDEGTNTMRVIPGVAYEIYVGTSSDNVKKIGSVKF